LHSEKALRPENERGVVAQTYHELQAIHVLERAAQKHPLAKASPESAIRAVFQGAEIALLNINDLLCRATGDLNEMNLGAAVTKLSWARGFHRVLVRLSSIPYELSDQVADRGSHSRLGIAMSPAYQAFLESVQTIEVAINRQIETGQCDLEQVIADESLDSEWFRIVHALRTMFHEHQVWAENLAEVTVPCDVTSFEEFVVTDLMTEAVYDTTLKGDTYFMQFRGLHQIPETLGFEVNDRIESAILALRKNRVQVAAEHLHAVNVLSTGILETLPVIADNLSTKDYHDIRENLGLTSGSHSVCFHFHMFRDLYDQLAEALDDYIASNYSPELKDGSINDVLSTIESKRFTDSQAFTVHLLITECLRFRMFTRNWRSLHLHLPRNNLGGEHTKSLTGAKDAVAAVRGLFTSAKKRDPLAVYARSRSAGPADDATFGSRAGIEVHTPALDETILRITGSITKSRFQNVQNRDGVFSQACPFSPPSKRNV
jgi:hypothetical protein